LITHLGLMAVVLHFQSCFLVKTRIVSVFCTLSYLLVFSTKHKRQACCRFLSYITPVLLFWWFHYLVTYLVVCFFTLLNEEFPMEKLQDLSFSKAIFQLMGFKFALKQAQELELLNFFSCVTLSLTFLFLLCLEFLS